MTPHVSHKELRAFGLLIGGVFLLIGLWPMLVRAEPPRLWAVVLGGGLMALGLVAPPSLRPAHRIWMKVGHVLGFINTRILLGVIYYGLLTPMGLVRRALGKDTLQRAFAADAETYRVLKSPRDPSHVKHQF